MPGAHQLGSGFALFSGERARQRACNQIVLAVGDQATAGERLAQRDFIGIFEIGPDR